MLQSAYPPREIHIPLDIELPGSEGAERPLTFLVTNTCYTQRNGGDMLQHFAAEVASDTMGRHYIRRSPDNGNTWTPAELRFAPMKRPDGVLRHGESMLFYDERHDTIIELVNEQLYPDGVFSGEAKRYTRIVFRLSFDGGGTFTPETPFIERGGTEKEWARDVSFGENCLQLSFCAATQLADGRIVLPVCLVPKGSDYDDFFNISWKAGCFLGTWIGTGYEWVLGEMVGMPKTQSVRGADEPTIEALSDGRLFMILRASNAGDPEIDGMKWFCVSDNSGENWSSPKPFTYADGSHFFSPAAGSRLIRSARTGRLYWIGNIVPDNPDGNRPRYPLQIAEIDEAVPGIMKETVRTIDDRRSGESELVQHSNFRVHEDRETGDIIVVTSRYQMRGREDPGSPVFRYRVSCPASRSTA